MGRALEADQRLVVLFPVLRISVVLDRLLETPHFRPAPNKDWVQGIYTITYYSEVWVSTSAYVGLQYHYSHYRDPDRFVIITNIESSAEHEGRSMVSMPLCIEYMHAYRRIVLTQTKCLKRSPED